MDPTRCHRDSESVYLSILEIGQDRFEGENITVDIGKDRNTHENAMRS
jgi:hypothetical protein